MPAGFVEGIIEHTGTAPKRRSLRLPGFDYSTHGAHFITICTQDHVRLLGEFDAEMLRVSAAGEMIGRWWREIPNKFGSAACDAFVVMPDHTHGILWLNQTEAVEPMNLMRVVAWFKTMTTNEYIRHVRDDDWPRFERRLWQRSYFDHVVRDQRSLDRLMTYIDENPLRRHLVHTEDDLRAASE